MYESLIFGKKLSFEMIVILSFQLVVGPGLTPTPSLIPNTPDSMRRALEGLNKRRMGTPSKTSKWLLKSGHLGINNLYQIPYHL